MDSNGIIRLPPQNCTSILSRMLFSNQGVVRCRNCRVMLSGCWSVFSRVSQQRCWEETYTKSPNKTHSSIKSTFGNNPPKHTCMDYSAGLNRWGSCLQIPPYPPVAHARLLINKDIFWHTIGTISPNLSGFYLSSLP